MPLSQLDVGDKFQLKRVLLTKDAEGEPNFGFPFVPNAFVEAQVLEHFKDTKKIVFKFRPKKHYKRNKSHRQSMTRFVVTKGEYGDKSAFPSDLIPAKA